MSDEMINRVRKLNDIAQRRGQSLAQMAVAWCFHKPEVTSVIIGASSTMQLKDNIDALKNTTFTDSELWEIGEV